MGKKKKQVPMTEEDRLAFDEGTKLLQEETRRKKETIISHFLKDKLYHEENAIRYNTLKLNLQWREVMKMAKAKELRKDIELLSQSFERAIDTKDMLIKSFAKELLEAGEVYAIAHRSHIQTVDHLLDLQKERLEKMTKEYCLELEMVCQEFDIERGLMIEQYHVDINNFEDIIFAMGLHHDCSNLEDKLDFESKDVELKNKCIENKQALRLQLETKIEDLWQQFRQILQKYNETTEEKKLTYQNLKEKDAKHSKEVLVNMRKIARMKMQISKLRAQLSQNAQMHIETSRVSKDDEEDDAFNKAERVRLIQHFYQVKAAIEQISLQRRAKLTQLTMEGNGVIKKLKQQKEKVTHILKAAEICSKLETEEEKILPFYGSSLTNEEEEDISAAISEPDSDLLAKVMDQFCGLDNFWKRYNKVLLDKLCINKEIEGLSKENHKLRRLLKRYMDSISVNKDSFRQGNTLLIASSMVILKSAPSDTSFCNKSDV